MTACYSRRMSVARKRVAHLVLRPSLTLTVSLVAQTRAVGLPAVTGLGTLVKVRTAD